MAPIAVAIPYGAEIPSEHPSRLINPYGLIVRRRTIFCPPIAGRIFRTIRDISWVVHAFGDHGQAIPSIRMVGRETDRQDTQTGHIHSHARRSVPMPDPESPKAFKIRDMPQRAGLCVAEWVRLGRTCT